MCYFVSEIIYTSTKINEAVGREFFPYLFSLKQSREILQNHYKVMPGSNVELANNNVM